jgi:hypothetical protein
LWKSLSAAVKTEAVRYIKSAGKEEKETRYYIPDSKASAEVMDKEVRSHRGIENRLHRQVDVSFSEGGCVKRYTLSIFCIKVRTFSSSDFSIFPKSCILGHTKLTYVKDTI